MLPSLPCSYVRPTMYPGSGHGDVNRISMCSFWAAPFLGWNMEVAENHLQPFVQRQHSMDGREDGKSLDLDHLTGQFYDKVRNLSYLNHCI